MKKILFIASHRLDRSPGQRFRFEQYINYLNSHGFKCDFSFMIKESYDKVMYTPGRFLSKFLIFISCFFHRTKDVLRANRYDIIFIQREAFMTGTTLFERLFKLLSNAKIVFDFDDSIWLADESPVNQSLSWLKNPNKTAQIIKLSDLVFAGNDYLSDYAKQNNSNVEIVPTTIDTEAYQRVEHQNDKVVIGWSGSFSTVKHFETAIPALLRIKEKYQDKVEFALIGDGNYEHSELCIKGMSWKKATEIFDLSKFDIGIMPLPNDKWSKGKCGLKGLQYMALEIPTIMSPVGVNTEIIEDGVNGFLADSDNEWVAKLSKLIDSEELRTKIGKKGRATVIEGYSVESQKDNYLRLLNSLIN